MNTNMRLFYFLRHGETESNVLRKICGGSSNPPLNKHGMDQVNNLSILISSLDLKIEEIYSSPLLRATQTAMPFAARMNIQIKIVENLKE